MNAERALLADALADFAGGTLSPREFARRMDGFLEARDEAVRDIALTMETTCEDDGRPAIAWSRDGWNMLQRCLLFLRSDTAFAEESEKWGPGTLRRRMGVPQWLAVGAILVVAWLFLVGQSPYAYWLAGLLTGGCLSFRGPFAPEWAKPLPSIDGVPMERLYPFESARQISRARRRTPDFAKEPYPERVERSFGESRHAGRFDAAVAFFMGPLYCLVAWPIVLPLLCVPDRVPRANDMKSGSAALETKR